MQFRFLSVIQSIGLSIYRSIYLFLLFFQSLFFPAVFLSSVCQSVFVYSSIYCSFHLSIVLSFFLSVSVCLSFQLSVFLSFFPLCQWSATGDKTAKTAKTGPPAIISGPRLQSDDFESGWFWNKSVMTATVSGAVWFWLERGADFLKVGASCHFICIRFRMSRNL